MSNTGLEVFDKTLHETNRYLKIVLRELGTDDRRIALAALRATLHALRDRLMPMDAVHLGAQLPMLVRGLYYEDWRPAEIFAKERHVRDFLAHVEALLPAQLKGYAEPACRAAFAAVEECIDPGETRKVQNELPLELRGLWPHPVVPERRPAL
jgi:uncharacterized protein (DUF2267 family)